MKTYSDLKNTYNWTKAIKNWHSRPHKVALFAALLSCLALGASVAKAQSAGGISCQSNSFSSAGTDACSLYLNGAAPSQIVVNLSSSDPAVTVPSQAVMNAGSSTSGFIATIKSVTSARTAIITASVNGVSATYAIQLNPTPAPPSQGQLSKISCRSNSFVSAGTDPCSVYLSGSAQKQTVVGLSSSDPAVTVPSKAYINPGNLTAGFSATIGSVTSARTATIIATLNGSSITFPIQLNPTGTNGNGTPSTPTLSAFTCSSATMTGPGSVTCTPTLSGAAPSGGVSVSVSDNSSAVAVPSAVTVAAGATSAPFAVTVSSFSTAQTVTLTATAGGVSKTFALQLSPSAPTLSINATSISFGSVAMGSQATQTVTLTSSGTAAVTVNAASVTGTGFSMSGSTFPVTLNPGQTLSLNVQFAPTVAGSATGKLTITSNSATNPAANIGLSGTGQAKSYAVNLNWNAPNSSTDPVVGYNVYRTPSGISSFQIVNSSAITPTNYSDSAVTSGQSYVYIVKSVDSSGVESAPSNSTTVAIP